MSLSNAITELDTGQSDEALYDQLLARTVSTVGTLSAAALSSVLVSLGLLSFVYDKVSATGDNSVIRNICLAVYARLAPEGGINFADPNNVTLLDVFLADANVAAILSAGGTNAATVKTTILTAATTVAQEFPNLRLIDVIRART